MALPKQILHNEITEAYDAVDHLIKLASETELLRELEHARHHLFRARLLTDEEET